MSALERFRQKYINVAAALSFEPFEDEVGNSRSMIMVRRPRRYAVHFDGRAPTEVLADRQTLDYWLRRIAKVADMTILSVQTHNIGAELVGQPVGEMESESGWSFLALITTSHLSIHTWPRMGFFMADLVSCKRFDPRDILHVSKGILRYSSLNVFYEHPGGNDNELC